MEKIDLIPTGIVLEKIVEIETSTKKALSHYFTNCDNLYLIMANVENIQKVFITDKDNVILDFTPHIRTFMLLRFKTKLIENDGQFDDLISNHIFN